MEVIENIDRAIVAKAMEELVNNVLVQPQAAGNVNMLVKDIEGHGREIRDKVEQM